ncbi:MAG: LapA family protein [Dokdonella sp.]
MRPGIIVFIILFALVGALFGAMNAETVVLDFYFFSAGAPIGAALLVVLGIGWILGGMVVWFARVPRLKRELKIARQAQATSP